VLVALTDALAQDLTQPFAALALERVYRSLYFFMGASQRGQARDSSRIWRPRPSTWASSNASANALRHPRDSTTFA
jgi:hypothetical protein